MRRRRFRSQRKSMYISLIILLFVFISVGYSYLSKTLNIAGNIAVTKTTWDVHFENAKKVDGNIDTKSGFSYNTDKTSVSLGLSFQEPGEYFEFEVDVINNGSINAMLGSIMEDQGNVLSKNGRSNYLEYTVTYVDGIPLTVKDRLAKNGGIDTLKVRIAFKDDVTEGNLPSADDTFTVTFQTTYVQDDGTSREREKGVSVQELVKRANNETVRYADVSDVKKKELFTFKHIGSTEVLDYRYIGNTPNNYIDFNDEVWRIIGVFNGKIKIIKDEGIDSNKTIMYDDKTACVSSSIHLGSAWYVYGSADWTDAQLMYMLNPTDYKLKVGYTLDGELIRDQNGNEIYHLGYYPYSITVPGCQGGGIIYPINNIKKFVIQRISYQQKANVVKVDGENNMVLWRLNNQSLSQTISEDYYVGSMNNNVTDLNAESIYQSEISSYIWNGRVALMYLSDYAYTFGKGVNEACYENTSKCCSDSYGIENANPSMSWLYKDDLSQWTLCVRKSSGTIGGSVYRIHSSGSFSDDLPQSISIVRPVVYLKSNIRLVGTGASDNHYRIVQ